MARNKLKNCIQFIPIEDFLHTPCSFWQLDSGYFYRIRIQSLKNLRSVSGYSDRTDDPNPVWHYHPDPLFSKNLFYQYILDLIKKKNPDSVFLWFWIWSKSVFFSWGSDPTPIYFSTTIKNKILCSDVSKLDVEYLISKTFAFIITETDSASCRSSSKIVSYFW